MLQYRLEIILALVLAPLGKGVDLMFRLVIVIIHSNYIAIGFYHIMLIDVRMTSSVENIVYEGRWRTFTGAEFSKFRALYSYVNTAEQ